MAIINSIRINIIMYYLLLDYYWFSIYRHLGQMSVSNKIYTNLAQCESCSDSSVVYFLCNFFCFDSDLIDCLKSLYITTLVTFTIKPEAKKATIPSVIHLSRVLLNYKAVFVYSLYCIQFMYT